MRKCFPHPGLMCYKDNGYPGCRAFILDKPDNGFYNKRWEIFGERENGKAETMTYNIDYEICSIIFLTVIILFSVVKGRSAGFQSRLFNWYIVGAFVNICLDIVGCYSIVYYTQVPMWFHYSVNSVFLAVQCLLPTMFAYYIYQLDEHKKREQKRYLKLMFLPAIAGAVLALSSPWTKAMFYMDAAGYHHGAVHTYLYINAVGYAIGTTIYVWIVRKRLGLRQTCIIGAAVFLALLPTLIQFMIPNYMLSGMGTALSIMILYMTSENSMRYVDGTTGALNREAFVRHMREVYYNGRDERIYVVALDNFKIVNEVYGMDGGNYLMRSLVYALQTEWVHAGVYRFGGDVFAVTRGVNQESVQDLDRLRKVLRRPWRIKDATIDISACIGLVHTASHEEGELVRAIDYAIAQAKSKGKGQFYEVDEKAVEEMVRRAAIEQAIMNSINSGHFEVYYQPIFDVSSGRFHSMEALARLNVPGYGYVSPEEFILIAENNGTILQIGIMVLEEVCRFISQYRLKDSSLDFVEVNLSVVQCMQDKIYRQIQEVLEQYHVPPSMINLEITESAEAYSEEQLIRNMARMSLSDITFSLDDYGSGYSNVNYLVDLPFSIVKIDKYIVWAAMKQVSSRRVLENTIAMFKEINLKVVAEGIENAEMMNMLTSMGADYLQGYYFSKPVPGKELVECLEEGYLEKIFRQNEAN